MSKPTDKCYLCKRADCEAMLANRSLWREGGVMHRQRQQRDRVRAMQAASLTPVSDAYDRILDREADRVDVLNEIAEAEARSDELLSVLKAGYSPALSRDNNKNFPLATGVLDYFPDALMEVAYVSKVGNEQHNPGEPLHWAKEKSTDEADSCIRHLRLRGTFDADGTRHSAKAAWRALANLQREIENERTK